jgi:alkylhydroperoxidase/carboxymuconolactone decarboxylase family protein YurZ
VASWWLISDLATVRISADYHVRQLYRLELVMTDDPYAHLNDLAQETFSRLMGIPNDSSDADSPMLVGRKIAFGDVWNRPHLSIRDRRLVTLTALALEARDETISMHVRGALLAGDLSADDLRELPLQVAVYAGFPRAAALNRIIEQVVGELETDRD